LPWKRKSKRKEKGKIQRKRKREIPEIRWLYIPLTLFPSIFILSPLTFPSLEGRTASPF
jgi:hypothetical protein